VRVVQPVPIDRRTLLALPVQLMAARLSEAAQTEYENLEFRGGLLCWSRGSAAAAIGRGGVKANKREGDGGTPRGRFRLLRLWWRPDRAPRPRSLLPIRPITRHLAWCEDTADRRYNRPFTRSASEPGDRLWRDDRLYDFIIELDHNTRPRIAGRGSAVFVHVARPNRSPTAGCVALHADSLRRLLVRAGPGTRIAIE
jgi:L,D-peptidoglycan transpeptidase YkuD (ErfK/YbiS/YcfS/YnhG family)